MIHQCITIKEVVAPKEFPWFSWMVIACLDNLRPETTDIGLMGTIVFECQRKRQRQLLD